MEIRNLLIDCHTAFYISFENLIVHQDNISYVADDLFRSLQLSAPFASRNINNIMRGIQKRLTHRLPKLRERMRFKNGPKYSIYDTVVHSTSLSFALPEKINDFLNFWNLIYRRSEKS